MNASKKKFLYTVLIILMVVDFYSIFNAGNPNSLFRYIIPDPSWDILTTTVLSLCIALISLSMVRGSDSSTVVNLLKQNWEEVNTRRDKGQSDEEIASSFIEALSLKREFSKRIIMKRVMTYLKRH